jgi:hypothetical protein
MKSKILQRWFLLSVMALGWAGVAEASGVDPLRTAMTSTVRIVSGDLEDGQLRGQTSGAGVIITAGGAVLTTRQAILLPDGRISPELWALMHESGEAVSLQRAVRLKVLAVSQDLDLALLQVVFRPGRESTIPFVSLAVEERIDYGAKVTLLGFTSAGGSTTVRRQSTILDFDERKLHADWLVVDGRIDPESTGGPVFNEQGRLIGIQTLVRQPRLVPFFGDEDFPIGLVNVGEVGYVRAVGAMVAFLLDPAAAPLQLSYPARPSPLQVSGWVRDARTGEPIPGAVMGIMLTNALNRSPIVTARELVAYGRSNFQGRFEASRRVLASRYLIKVVHPQYQTILREITIAADQRELTIEMVRN